LNEPSSQGERKGNPVKVYEIDGVVPVVDPTAYVHPSAVLIGDVVIGPRAYIGPCASLRGDFGRLFIGAGANVQDCCVMHGFPGSDTIVEEDGHIGHGAILHGCIVRRNGMVGMNAVVMDNAVVGESAIVAAQSFVKAGLDIPAAHAGRRRAGQGDARTDRTGNGLEDRGHQRLSRPGKALPWHDEGS
jgi:carbonic anhydrase/acetyltransferase-like protein (isoleucine patch superfamily)